MDKVELDFEFTINGAQAKAEADGVKASVSGAGFSAEEAAKKLISAFNPALGLLEQLENEANQLKIALKGATSGQEIDSYKAKLSAVVALQSQLNKGLDDASKKGRVAYNGLQNSINQLSRELPAFTFSAQTGFLALSNNIPILFDEIGRLKQQNLDLTASGQKGIPIWKQLSGALFSWGTLLSVGVTLLTIYGKEIGNFIGALFKGKEAINQAKESITILNKAIESTDFKKATVSIDELTINIDLAKKGLIDKKDVLEQYNTTIGKTTGQVQSLDEAEKAMVKNADAYVKMTLYKAAAQLSLEEAAKKSMEAELSRRKKLEDFSDGFLDASVTNIRSKEQYNSQQANIKANRERRKQEEIKIATDAEKVLEDIGREFQEKAAKISSKNKFDFFGKADDKAKEAEKLANLARAAMDKILAERKGLMEKISDIDAEYLRKTYSKDEEELLALKDKFSKIRKLVEEFNKKNPKKAISLTEFDKVEGIATNDLRYRQGTEKLKGKLELEKKLYEDFEAFKLSLGEQKAKERFAKQINTERTFLQKLGADYAVTYAQGLAGGFNGAVTERLTSLQKAIDAEVLLQQKKQDELIKSLQSYEKQRAVLIEAYNSQKSGLDTVKNADEIAELDKQLKLKLSKLDDGHVQELSAFKALFKEIEKLSDEQAKKVINDAKKMLKAAVDAGTISSELAKTIIDRINQGQQELSNRFPEKLIAIAGQIDNIANSVSKLNGVFGDVLSSLANLLMQVGNIRKAVSAYNKEGATGLEKFAAGANLVAIGVSAATSLIGIFTSTAQARKKAEEEYYASVLRFQNDYNLSLNEEIRLRTALSDNVFVKDLKGRITDGTAALVDANAKYLKSLEDLKAGQAKLGQRNVVDPKTLVGGAASGAILGATIGSVVPVIGTAIGAVVGGIAGLIGGLFGGKKKKDLFGSLLQEYPELLQTATDGTLKFNAALAKSLIANNLVDDKTKALLENTIALAEARKEALEQINGVITDLAGNLGNDLRNTLVDAFREGSNSAVAFGKTVEGVLENIVSQMLFSAVFGESFDKLQKEMKESYDIGGDGSFVDDITRFFKEAGPGIDAFNQGLKAAQEEAAKQGLNLFGATGSGSKNSGLSAAKIQDAITESTGSEIVGAQRAVYEMTKQNAVSTKENTLVSREIKELQSEGLDIMREQVLIQLEIQTNTSNTVVELKNAVIELKDINKNTKTQGSRATS